MTVQAAMRNMCQGQVMRAAVKGTGAAVMRMLPSQVKQDSKLAPANAGKLEEVVSRTL